MEEYSASREEKNSSGCVTGCISLVVLVPILLVVGAYFTLMHSTVPLRVVAGLANKAEGITIRGIDGSISGGFTVAELRVADGDGYDSVMEGLALKWKDLVKLRKSNELIIEEISLDRAHFFFDLDLSSEEDDEEGESQEGDPAPDDGDSFDLRVFELRKVDIRKVVFESKNSELKVEIDEIFLKGLRIEEDSFSLEDLSVGSNFVDLQLEDAAAVEIEGTTVPFTRQVRGVLKSIVHPSVLKDIDFKVEMGAMGGEMVARVHAFEDSVVVLNSDAGRDGFMVANHFSAAEYFAPDLFFLPDDLSITMRHRGASSANDAQSVEIGEGGFTIGTARFVVAPQVLVEEDAPILATSGHAGLDFTATVRIVEEGAGLGVELESQPATEPRELMALLLYGKAYDGLDVAGKEQVDGTLKRFRFSKSDPAPNPGR